MHAQQATGGGSVLSFTTGNAELSKRQEGISLSHSVLNLSLCCSFVDSLRLFKVTVSFGSCNSLVELPCLLSHASIPKDRRTLPEVIFLFLCSFFSICLSFYLLRYIGFGSHEHRDRRHQRHHRRYRESIQESSHQRKPSGLSLESITLIL